MLPCSFVRRAPRVVRGRGVVGQQQQVRLLLPPGSGSGSDSRNGSSPSLSTTADVVGDVFAPANVLSKENREQCLRRLSRIPSLRPPSTSGDAKPKEAAVLVPLCVVNGEVCLLFTLRSPHMSSHRGQVSFPGGMKDDADGTHENTALRETEEELGLAREGVDVWGRCPAMESANRVAAVPVIGHLGEVDVTNLQFNPKEVGEVFTISLRHLCDRRNFGYTQFRTGKGYSIPVFLGGKYRIWGLTAGVTHIFLSALLPTVYKNKVHHVKPIKL